MTDYLHSQISKFCLVVFVLLSGLILLGSCSATDTRDLRRAYETQVESGRAPRAGDIVVVSGPLVATPAILPERFPAFRNALAVIKRHDKWRWGKREGWRETRRIVWRAKSRRIGNWSLDDSVIDHADFDRFLASPCSDYQPPPGWVENCPFSDYVKLADDSNRRFSYLIAPIPDGPVTLIAAASNVPGTLTSFTYRRFLSDEPFAIVMTGTWTGDELLAQRLHVTLGATSLCLPGLFLVAWLFSHTIRSRLGRYARDRTVGGDLWRATFVTAPYAVVFWPFRGEDAMWAALIATAISSLCVLFIWSEGRGVRRSSFE